MDLCGRELNCPKVNKLPVHPSYRTCNKNECVRVPLQRPGMSNCSKLRTCTRAILAQGASASCTRPRVLGICNFTRNGVSCEGPVQNGEVGLWKHCEPVMLCCVVEYPGSGSGPPIIQGKWCCLDPMSILVSCRCTFSGPQLAKSGARERG